jgi:ribosomal protein S12 methylthiotransferase
MQERLAEVSELQDDITAMRRDLLVGTRTTVLVDSVGVARSHREAPEIDGVVLVDESLVPRNTYEVTIVESLGVDVRAELVTQSSANGATGSSAAIKNAP